MQQEMIKEKELEFIIPNRTKLECPRCKRHLNSNCFIFNRVFKASICHQCSKSVGTNPFYNQNYGKRKEFVGIKNLSYQERKMLVQKYINKGFSPYQAKNKVEYNLNVIKGIKIKKTEPECSNQNLNIQKKDRAMTNELIKGLGFKEKRL